MYLIKNAFAVLNDAKFYLRQISQEQYSKPIQLLLNATIGSHTRHFVEGYQCLLKQAPSTCVNYGLRIRNKGIETDPLTALTAIKEIEKGLASLPIKEIPLKLSMDLESKEYVQTTFGRELQYNNEHCIHHLAIIRIGLSHILPSLSFPEHFGFAPSTLKYQEKIANAK